MADFIKINGTAVRTTAVYERAGAAELDGPPTAELEFVVILRGSMAHRSFLQLIAREPIRVDLPKGADWLTYEMTIGNAIHASSGVGEAAVFRHDVTLRETRASAAERARQAAVVAAEAAAEAAARPPEPVVEEVPEELPDEPGAAADYSAVSRSGDRAVWATAMEQLHRAPGAKASAPEPPMTAAELAGVEAVLVNLRMEALIEQLASAGLVRRSVVESAFQLLVRRQFVTDATPVVGEKTALRAARELLGEG